MAAQQFSVGDVVRLKSGGPRMVIAQLGRFGYEPTDRAKCEWFEGGKRGEDVFELSSLELQDTHPRPTFATMKSDPFD